MKVVEVGSKIICVGLLIFQGMMINAYLAKLHSSAWWSWIVADISIIIIWSACLMIVRKSFSSKKNDPVDVNEIKYTFIAWFVYVLLLCPRIVLLFHDLAKTLNEKDFLGPNFLKMSVSCTPIIYFLLVYGSHNSNKSRHLSAQGVAAAGALDLFDSIDLLEFLFLPEEGIKFPRGYLHASLTFACISFFSSSFVFIWIALQSTPWSCIIFIVQDYLCSFKPVDHQLAKFSDSFGLVAQI